MFDNINVFELEKELIDPSKWDSLYLEMPDEVKKVVDENKINPQPIGIGRNKEVGWFVLGCGQGPYIEYLERVTL